MKLEINDSELTSLVTANYIALQTFKNKIVETALKESSNDKMFDFYHQMIQKHLELSKRLESLWES